MLERIKNLKKLKNVTSKLPVKSKGDQMLVGLDVGTEYVKALIARVDGDELEILGVGRAHQSLRRYFGYCGRRWQLRKSTV